jgi:hypothetical protein
MKRARFFGRLSSILAKIKKVYLIMKFLKGFTVIFDIKIFDNQLIFKYQ